ncbi:D-alanyl-D-alanine carboxypeptidase family protein [Erysipelothrix aquatica]|uniref:D-alanyl-D-alanine carboxypeptidase family protein n=1 Tax=Erysipelothrix aquatica TaxID=2683714 RepID=UPI001358123A|nr:serine hydrolase [Erysipelothrix aquatica]
MKKYTLLLFVLGLLANMNVSTLAASDAYYSTTYLLVNRDTGAILEQLNDEKLIHPASLTKIMTTFVALEMMDENQLNETYTLTHDIFYDLVSLDASVAGFDAGETVKIIDILYGIMLPSGADATRAIANYISGSEDAFVRLMNQKAHELGLENTHFENTSGLDHPNHLTTAHDLQIILEAALKNSTFKKIFAASEYQSSPTNYKESGYIWVDKNLEFANGVDPQNPLTGTKSGYTELAGSALASTATVNGSSYMLISSGAPYTPFDFYNVQDALKFYSQVTNTSALAKKEKPETVQSKSVVVKTPEKPTLFSSNLFFLIGALATVVGFLMYLVSKV